MQSSVPLWPGGCSTPVGVVTGTMPTMLGTRAWPQLRERCHGVLMLILAAASVTVLAMVVPARADERLGSFDSSLCATDPAGTTAIALGRIVLHVPADALLGVGHLAPDQQAEAPDPPDRSQPAGCPDHPVAGSNVSLLYAVGGPPASSGELRCPGTAATTPNDQDLDGNVLSCHIQFGGPRGPWNGQGPDVQATGDQSAGTQGSGVTVFCVGAPPAHASPGDTPSDRASLLEVWYYVDGPAEFWSSDLRSFDCDLRAWIQSMRAWDFVWQDETDAKGDEP